MGRVTGVRGSAAFVFFLASILSSPLAGQDSASGGAASPDTVVVTPGARYRGRCNRSSRTKTPPRGASPCTGKSRLLSGFERRLCTRGAAPVRGRSKGRLP